MTPTKPWTARVLTLYPSMFPGPLSHALAGKAREDGIWALETVDIRDFASDKHRSVDDTPFGGGPGMVMRADVLAAAIDATAAAGGADQARICLTPRGAPLSQARVRDLSRATDVMVVCGRFEGIDQRVIDARDLEEVSVGDFVLSGGEVAAMALIDACVRLLPGVVGDAVVLEEESFDAGLLEYPHYTRPRDWDGRAVPDVLLSGHHADIRTWRQAQRERATRIRRPDMWRRYRGTETTETDETN
jgi:tRNA (guanine37-N1)-methyltransferase